MTVGGTAVRGGGFLPGDGPIYLDNLGCDGSEDHLVDCDIIGFGILNCRHFEDAGVKCRGEHSHIDPTLCVVCSPL